MNEARDPIRQLIKQLKRLPGVGEKTATRLAYFILRGPEDLPQSLADALVEVKAKVGFCERCWTLTEGALCSICLNERRDHSLICVVESVQDLLAIERTGDFDGVYHVLHGVIAPLEGVGPNQLKLQELILRLQEREITEVIVATNPSVEGEATALYIKNLIGDLGPKLSRIASGLPIGSNLEYADRVTLGRSLSDRREL